MSKADPILGALRKFAGAVSAKSSQLAKGAPEDQLRNPFENFLKDVADAWGWKVVCTGEPPLEGHIGRPDFAVSVGGLLAGYVELKAPGTGAAGKNFKGRDREQFKRFSAIPNLLYTDGNEWTLYRSGEQTGKLVRLSGDIVEGGARAATAEDAQALEPLLRDFLGWNPILPVDHQGDIDFKGFADMLAPLCRLLRGEAADALRNPGSGIAHIKRDWQKMLFPLATDKQFADAYAQTVVFALLLGRAEGAEPLTVESAVEAVAAKHSLLSRALEILTEREARPDVAASLDLLLRVIAVVPPALFSEQRDPWLYFYEDFLAAYDPKMRKDAGVYYTPAPVVRAQVRLLDDLLVNRLDRPLGFADPRVVTLDPAVGTGTYLLGVIEHALDRVKSDQGAGAVSGHAEQLAENLYGFEIMVGAYAVADMRVSRTLIARGARDETAANILLADTLESPYKEPQELSYRMRPISEQRARALVVKRETPVLVCLGNPPYDRHEAFTGSNKDRTGSWVRWGEGPDGEALSILQKFIKPVRDAGRGGRLPNLYNLYVYFWCWALWKVFDQEGTEGSGAVSFITASSWLDGDAFLGMREYMRRTCDEVWILDIGGGSLGPRKNENVFAIRTPVAIGVACRVKKTADMNQPARVRYARIEGSRSDKLKALDSISNFTDVEWQDCPNDWQAPFRPTGEGAYFEWPLFTDLMPWQHSGAKLSRTWPIAPDEETLGRRWRELLQADDRREAFHETRDRKVDGQYKIALTGRDAPPPLSTLPDDAPLPEVHEYAYRSFDRQRIIADGRLMDCARPPLWRCHGERQVYFTSLFSTPLGRGPALTCAASVPDLHHFGGGGAKDVVPLYRTADASQANVTPGLLEFLSGEYGRPVSEENFVAYLYGVSAHSAFTERFTRELESRELHVPVTRDADLFEKIRATGARLIWLHTWGRRFVHYQAPPPPGGDPARRGQVHPSGAQQSGGLPRCIRLRQRDSNALGRRGRVRAGGSRGLRVRGVGPRSRPVVAPLSHEAGSRQKVLTAR